MMQRLANLGWAMLVLHLGLLVGEYISIAYHSGVQIGIEITAPDTVKRP